MMMYLGLASNGRFPFHITELEPNHNEERWLENKSKGWMLLVVILPTL
jgi:hypothetical protein